MTPQRSLFLLLAFLLSAGAAAQNWEWAKSLGAPNSDTKISALGRYEGDQVLLAGSFAASALALGDQTLTGAGQDDAFVAICSDDGDYSWAARIGGSGREFAACVAAAPDGGLYVGGSFTSLSMNVGSQLLLNLGESDGFIVKYNADKTVAWARSVGAGQNDAITGLAVDPEGNLYACGHTGDALLLMKIDSDNALLWQKNIGSSLGSNQSTALALGDDGHCYWAGTVKGKLTFNGLDTLESLQELDWFEEYQSVNSGFLAKYNPAGDPVSAVVDTNVYQLNDLTYSLGHLYACGEKIQPFLVVAGPSYPQAWSKAYVSKYSDNLELIWRRTPENANFWSRTLDVVKAIDHDDMGNIYTSGYLHAYDLVFNGDTIENIQHGFFYYSQALILKYDAEGNEIYAKTLGGNLNDVGTALLVTGKDELFIGGSYQSNSFTVNGIQLQNLGTLDSFIVHAITPVYFRKTLGLLAKFYDDISSVLHPDMPNIACYPNPAQSLVHFSAEISYQVFDLYGRPLLNGLGNFVNIEALPSGAYLLIANKNQVIRILKN
ncbi:MAG: hypothetical protein ACKV1O_28700 [Saprospiraceae bacterium]